MMPATLPKFPILETAAALGISIDGRQAHCFNAASHSDGKDTNPSLVFFPDSNRYKCFACGVRGDAIDLVRAVRGLRFQEALAWLNAKFPHAAAAGLAFNPQVDSKPPASKAFSVPDERAVEVYAALYAKCYEVAPFTPAGEYLIGRGLDLDLANEYLVGELYNPQEAREALGEKFSIDQIRAAGLVSRAGNFLFARHPLLFFYFNDGYPVYIQGRDITGNATCKELSLSGLCSPVPYNAALIATQPERVCLCEGCIDTLSALQMGYPAVGVPGVRGFRPEWFTNFQGISQIDILFDNDTAGQQAAVELKSLFLQRGQKAKILRPRNVNDMNDLLLSKLHGGEL
jgi:DNA primase